MMIYVHNIGLIFIYIKSFIHGIISWFSVVLWSTLKYIKLYVQYTYVLSSSFLTSLVLHSIIDLCSEAALLQISCFANDGISKNRKVTMAYNLMNGSDYFVCHIWPIRKLINHLIGRIIPTNDFFSVVIFGLPYVECWTLSCFKVQYESSYHLNYINYSKTERVITR